MGSVPAAGSWCVSADYTKCRVSGPIPADSTSRSLCVGITAQRWESVVYRIGELDLAGVFETGIVETTNTHRLNIT